MLTSPTTKNSRWWLGLGDHPNITMYQVDSSAVLFQPDNLWWLWWSIFGLKKRYADMPPRYVSCRYSKEISIITKKFCVYIRIYIYSVYIYVVYICIYIYYIHIGTGQNKYTYSNICIRTYICLEKNDLLYLFTCILLNLNSYAYIPL